MKTFKQFITELSRSEIEDKFYEIKGKNNYILTNSGSKVENNIWVGKYRLENEKEKLDTIYDHEKDYEETNEYFYYKVKSNPNIYAYLSKLVGGALVFLGKGRWSGNAEDFGKTLKKDLIEYISNNQAMYAIEKKEVEKILKNNFDIDFSFDERNNNIIVKIPIKEE